MSSAKLQAAAAIALFAGPWLFVRGFRHFRTFRLIENTPTARIRSMAMGLVEVNGAAEQRSGLEAPFSGRSCAYWEVDISVKGRNSWSVIHRNQSGQPFYLRDETGVALVYPRGAECRTGFQLQEECHGLSLPPCYSEYLKEHSLGIGVFGRLGRLRFRERLLEDGFHVYVLGSAFPRSRAHVVAEGEWLEATGTDDPFAVHVRGVDAEVSAVIRRGEHESTFIISVESERAVVTELRWKAYAMLLGGPLMTLFALAYWLLKLQTGSLL